MEHSQLEHRHHKKTENTIGIFLIADDFQSPENIGSLFRLADAFGVEKLFLCGKSPRPPNKKIKRVSRSTEKHVSYQYLEDPIETLQKLKHQGYQLIGLEITTSSITLADFKIHSGDKICLLLGSENTGLRKELLDIVDQCIHIPMRGHNSSMNVSHACAIALYEITKYL